jgi:ribosome-associated protein
MRSEDVHIPQEALSETFLAGSGPGGQNVNKVATAVQLRVNLGTLGLDEAVLRRLKRIAGSKLTTSGEILIAAKRFRTREANREDARRRLAKMVARAHVAERKRKPTRPSRAAKAKRIETKKQRGAIKQTRGKVAFD